MFIKNVFIVNCTEDNFNKIKKHQKKSAIINPYNIITRLEEENKLVSDDIVNFNIIKQINSYINCDKSTFIYYYTKNINKNFIQQIKSLFSNMLYDIKYNLLIDKNFDKKMLDKIKNEFETISYVENI